MRLVVLSLAGLSAAMLGGCAGTQAHSQMLQNGGALQWTPGTEPGVDFVVMARNVLDIGYDGDDEADRKTAVRKLFEAQCPNLTFLSESAIEQGKTIFGRAHRTYVMKLACNKA